MAYDIEILITDQAIEVEMSGATSWPAIADKPATFPPAAHNHDDRYYSDAEVDNLLTGKADALHSHTPDQVSADPFQTPAFANPLVLDATEHKDFRVTITGATDVGLTNSSDGDSGVIELFMDALGGYAVNLGAMFTVNVTGGAINNAANKKNYIFWFNDGININYSIQVV